MTHILVTGGLGYIGAHMVQCLQAYDIEVTVIDNNWHGNPNVLGDDVEVVIGDIRNNEVLDALFSCHKFDGVMHFASRIQVGESVEKPDLYYDNNVNGTVAVLNAMVRHGVEYFIGSSTAAIFGEPAYHPIDEKHVQQPLSPYGRSKLIMEQIAQDYEKAYGMKCGMLRYFNAAGCSAGGDIGELHEPETHLIPLILQVASGRREKIYIFGDDYQTPDHTCIRDYIHVVDLAEAHLLLLNYLQGGGNERHFNLGTGTGYSILEVITMAEKVTSGAIVKEYHERREGDPAILIADGTKAEHALQWKPQFSDLETILQHAWQWEQILQKR